MDVFLILLIMEGFAVIEFVLVNPHLLHRNRPIMIITSVIQILPSPLRNTLITRLLLLIS